MNFLDYEADASGGDIVEVTLDSQANVRLLDSINFSRYQRGQQHQGIGGRALRSPVRLAVPSSGHWHVVVDPGGYVGTVGASVRVIHRAVL
jgi:Domain of unknown function (DUF1883)